MTRRDLVLWIGDPPPQTIVKEFSARDLRLAHREGGEHVLSDLSRSRGIVLSIRDEHDPLVSFAREQIVELAACHGTAVEVVTSLRAVQSVSQRFSTSLFKFRSILVDTQLGALPERLARTSSGPVASATLELTGAEGCDDEQVILLRRAFSDCTSVSLKPLPGGRSASVFQAFGRLADSRAGPYPLPFFAKLDRRNKIERELTNYEQCTTHFVPFYARPNLDHGRCVLGARHGLIVGNFVEHSESLLDLVDAGRAQHALHSVFDDALRGWRAQAQWSGSGPTTGRITESMGGGALYGRAPSSSLAKHGREAARFGSARNPEAIAAALDGLPPRQFLESMTHGDLHGENVRVRSGQAIVIDFASVQAGPLVSDVAQLEVSLCMFAARACDERQWCHTMTKVFDPATIETVPPVCDPGDPLASLCNSVRQLRRIGLGDQRSQGEYAGVLAVHLLRQASHDRDEREQVSRRPMLVWLADRIAATLERRRSSV